MLATFKTNKNIFNGILHPTKKGLLIRIKILEYIRTITNNSYVNAKHVKWYQRFQNDC